MGKIPLHRVQRSFLEIANSILDTCQTGALKTHVMYRCNLNSRQVEDYLQYLDRRGLIEKRYVTEGARNYYVTTEKGRKCLSMYEQMIDVLTGGRRVGNPPLER